LEGETRQWTNLPGRSRGKISRQPNAQEKNGQMSIWNLEGRPVGGRENMIDGTRPWVVSEEQTARKRRSVVLRSPRVAGWRGGYVELGPLPRKV
jgi:hypothetical protein